VLSVGAGADKKDLEKNRLCDVWLGLKRNFANEGVRQYQKKDKRCTGHARTKNIGVLNGVNKGGSEGFKRRTAQRKGKEGGGGGAKQRVGVPSVGRGGKYDFERQKEKKARGRTISRLGK